MSAIRAPLARVLPLARQQCLVACRFQSMPMTAILRAAFSTNTSSVPPAGDSPQTVAATASATAAAQDPQQQLQSELASTKGPWTPLYRSQGEGWRFHNVAAGAYPEVAKHGIPQTRKEASQRILNAIVEDGPPLEDYPDKYNMYGKPDPDFSNTVAKRIWKDRLERTGRFIESIAARGPFETVKRFLQMNEARSRGVFKGTDLYGNNYYEDLDAIFGRQRLVVFKKFTPQGGDASEIPAEWHGWLHHMVDEVPTEMPPSPVAYKVRHRKMASEFGESDNHLPPGHYRRQDPNFTTATYEGWRPGKQQPQQ